MDLGRIGQFDARIFMSRTDGRLLTGPMLRLNGDLIADEDMGFPTIAGDDMRTS